MRSTSKTAYILRGGASPAIASSHFGQEIKVAILKDRMKVINSTKEGFIDCPVGGVLDVAISDTRRGRVINNGKTTNTLDALCRIGLNVDDVRIRKLTPKECFRLQGFPDEYFDRAAEVCSDSQLYKQAGNSVTVNVIYEIAKRLEV